MERCTRGLIGENPTCAAIVRCALDRRERNYRQGLHQPAPRARAPRGRCRAALREPAGPAHYCGRLTLGTRNPRDLSAAAIVEPGLKFVLGQRKSSIFPMERVERGRLRRRCAGCAARGARSDVAGVWTAGVWITRALISGVGTASVRWPCAFRRQADGLAPITAAMRLPI